MKLAASLITLLALVLVDPASPPDTQAIIVKVDEERQAVELPPPTFHHKNDFPKEQKVLHPGTLAPVSLNVHFSRNYFEALVPPSRELVTRESGRNACPTAQANTVFGSRLSPLRQQGITLAYSTPVQEKLEYFGSEYGFPDSKMVGSAALVLADPVSPPGTRETIIDRADDGPQATELAPQTFDDKNDLRQEQKILHPGMPATARIKVPRAVDPEARAFGKLVDCASLQPGDLLLSQELHPDAVSKLISKVQLNGGYSEEDAQWTHAAMYLGDGANVIEATFDSIFTSGSVRITSLDNYCQGKYLLRFRRSKHVLNAQNGWALCIRALTHLKQPYSFAHAAKLWWDVVIRKCGFYDPASQRPTSKAAICSTLYADAHHEATRRRLGEIGGVCVPAWLSVSDEFSDVAVGWAQIA
jgi:hypothetical protein